MLPDKNDPRVGAIAAQLGVTRNYARQLFHEAGYSDGMLSTREVADALGVSVYTVRNWLNAGRLQGTRLAGSQRWRVDPEEVERIKAL